MKVYITALVLLFLSSQAVARVLGPESGEVPYVPLHLLSDTEIQAVTNEFDQNPSFGKPGSLALVYPDSKAPLFDLGDIEEVLSKLQLVIISYPGLPTTVLGAINSAKAIAITNKHVVLAVNTGEGNEALFTMGPKAFMNERQSNGHETFYRNTDPLTLEETNDPTSGRDPVNSIVHPLLERIHARNSDTGKPSLGYWIYSHSVGSLKASSFLYALEYDQSSLLEEMHLISYGVGVNVPKETAGYLSVIGNKDEFGRINSTNLENSHFVLGGKHSIRSDLKAGLPIQMIREVQLRMMGDYELYYDISPETQLAALNELIAEAESIPSDALVERLHQTQLSLKKIRLQLELSPEDTALKAAMRKAQNQLKSLKHLRNQQIQFLQDLEDYNKWKLRGDASECNAEETIQELCKL